MSKLSNKIKSATLKRANKIFYRNNYLLKAVKPIVSFTFDDFPKTSATNGRRILNEYKKKGTYFLSLNLLGGLSDVGLAIADLNDVDNLLSDGHQIGNHTFDHLNALKVSDAFYENSIKKNIDEMNKLFPSYIMETFAYPFGSLTPSKKKIVKKYYKIARGIEGGFNKHFIDLLLLKSYHLSGEKDKLNYYMDIIDYAIKKKHWVIFFTHEVQKNPTQFGCDEYLFESLLNYCLSREINILSVEEVMENYILNNYY